MVYNANMIKRISFAFVLLGLTGCAGSLANCHQIKPTDPAVVCDTYQQCLTSVGKDFSPDEHDTCIKEVSAMTGDEALIQDVAFNDCQGLPPCAFSLCMQVHVTAKKNASRVTQGK